LTTKPEWPSGTYLAKLTQDETGVQNYIVLTIRDDSSHSAYLFANSINTYSAYNYWGGYGLYGPTRSAASSFSKPYDRNYGSGDLPLQELGVVRWLERNGYDVTYTSNVDVDSQPSLLLNHQAFLSVGHDEYWSSAQRNGVIQALNAGVSLGFLGANEAWWRVEYGGDGADRDLLVSYKIGDVNNGPCVWTSTDYSQNTCLWSSIGVSPNTENSLSGIGYTGYIHDLSSPFPAFTPSTLTHWAYSETALQPGQSLPNLIGGEYDTFDKTLFNADSLSILGNSTFNDNGNPGASNATIYQAPSGAWVFAAGTNVWNFLDNDDYGDMVTFANWQNHQSASPALRRMTTNILDTFSAAGVLALTYTPGPQALRISRSPDGRLEVFALGNDGALWHTWQVNPQSGPWSPWYSFGGSFSSNPVVTQNPVVNQQVFIISTDGTLYSQWQSVNLGEWSGWANLGAPSALLTGDPSVGINSDGRLEVFARGRDGNVYHIFENGLQTTWSTFESLGCAATSNIAVVRNANNVLEIFFRGADGTLSHMWQIAPGQTWSRCFSMRTQVVGDPFAMQDSTGSLHVFYVSTDKQLMHVSGGGLMSWTLPGTLSNDSVSGAPRVGMNPDRTLQVFIRGADNSLLTVQSTSASGTQWNTATKLSGFGIQLGSNPDVINYFNGNLDVFWMNPDGQLNETWYNPPSWVSVSGHGGSLVGF
jgi:hypothetical protein